MYFPPNAPEKLSGTYTGIFQQTTRKSLISCWFAFFIFSVVEKIAESALKNG